jgi:ATP-dependent DNA helicase DinG
MIIKLKQGVGRLIRTEQDTGCIAILDSRVNEDGAYRERVLNALPDCYVTADMNEVEGFFRVMKKPSYFLAE